MIAFVEGFLVESSPLKVVVDVNGVGYELHTPLSTTAKIGRIGDKVKLLTQLVVREDSQTLYGFCSVEEKTAFISLTEKVSGIGPKTALNILSRLSVESLQSAVSSGNVKLLTECPGIGKKTAERLILELKDVFQKNPLIQNHDGQIIPEVHAGSNQLIDDAVAALMTLGFKQNEAEKKVNKVLKDGNVESVGVLIKKALNG